MSEKAF